MASDHSPFPIPESPLFVLVAGEASGDLLGADLLDALRARYPAARFAGIGGPRMIAAGLESWHPIGKLSVMGLVEVLRHLPELLAIRRDVARRTLASRPDAFIGIDAPDFNIGLERRLRANGLRTVHYVSPSIWAWREKRAAKIGRSAGRVLCLFPMEPPIYARHGVDARFVGHPLADAMPLEPDQHAARAAIGLPMDVPVLALLPGSRLGEIARLGRDFIDAARLLMERVPRLRIVAPMANADCRHAFEAIAREAGMPTRDLRGSDAEPADAQPAMLLLSTESGVSDPQRRPLSQLAMVAADAVLLASGTATLEAMLAKRPMVVAYRIAPMTHRIVKGLGLLKVGRYALPNVLAGRDIAPELMQDDCTPDALAHALAPLLQARAADTALLAEYRRLHLALRRDASASAAAAIADYLAAPGA
ncbi:MAG: lipid-A-disaccharide synthase [Lysobacteraceae bacterium]|nr:MAG: lipid-A-disaccharide synthase [Xanthomonadaceae bacterium]